MSDNRKSMAMGAGLGVVGMSAYYLPITKIDLYVMLLM